jgi:signal transduction histidine kinase
MFDDAGRLWIAMPGLGVVRIDEPDARPLEFRSYTTADGLAHEQVRCLVQDNFGRIYVGSLRGVERLDPTTGSVRHYSTADGLAASHVITAHRDAAGAIWFGTLLGLSRLVPQPDAPIEAPPVWIRRVSMAGAEQPVSEFGAAEVTGLEMGPDRRQIGIEFTSLTFRTGERIRFQYRLEGGRIEWTEPTAARDVDFANLAPGRYRFEVRAVNSEGVISPEPATVSFRILPPFWKRWWFVAFIAGVLVSLAYTYHRLRLRRVVELERVRTRIATDLHDDIGSSLSRVSILSEVVRQQVRGERTNEAEPLLAQIAETARDLVDSMSDIVWAVNPKRDRTADLVQRMRRFASDTLSGRGIALRFLAPEDGQDRRLGLELRRQVYLIFKEAVNNAARHSGCQAVEIAFDLGPRSLSLHVKDDGRGFDPGAEGRGHGLESMRGRAEGLRGRLDVLSTPGEGTAVLVHVPLKGRR